MNVNAHINFVYRLVYCVTLCIFIYLGNQRASEKASVYFVHFIPNFILFFHLKEYFPVISL